MNNDIVKIVGREENSSTVKVYTMMTANLTEFLNDRKIIFSTDPTPAYDDVGDDLITHRKKQYHTMTIGYSGNRIDELILDWLILVHAPQRV
jgi:hypothetical protein